eukprot:scaffold478689_cov28-Prasinocladus_malaysianus.AAC.1
MAFGAPISLGFDCLVMILSRSTMVYTHNGYANGHVTAAKCYCYDFPIESDGSNDIAPIGPRRLIIVSLIIGGGLFGSTSALARWVIICGLAIAHRPAEVCAIAMNY